MDIRNIAIIAHVDHGKTTLVDAMLKQTHTFRENQKEMQQTLILDSNELEKEKGITILSKNTSVFYKNTKINIIDTPGHADFGGEVERVLNMASGALLLVDALEGPLPQTKFVLKKALEAKLKIILILNKIDKKDARPQEVMHNIETLFLELAEDDSALNFTTLYAVGRDGKAFHKLPQSYSSDTVGDLTPIFETILKEIPGTVKDCDKPFQMLISTLDNDDYIGKLCIGKVSRGKLKKDQLIALTTDNRVLGTFKVQKLLTSVGLERREVAEVLAGDIVAIAGIPQMTIGLTICDPIHPESLPKIKIDDPTIKISLGPNTSPLAGREGKFTSSVQIRQRLFKEAETNLGLHIIEKPESAKLTVAGRGELQLSVLIETLRREGYELEVSKPQVIYKTINGAICEPYEEITIEVTGEFVGIITEEMAKRHGQILSLTPEKNNVSRFVYKISSHNLLGIRNVLLGNTRGTAILNTYFIGYFAKSGRTESIRNGSLIASESGTTLSYGLANAQMRGNLFVGPGVLVYEGMIVGISSRQQDIEVNVCKAKKQTNMRSSTADIAIQLTPPTFMDLEQMLDFVKDDEMIEATPKSLRLRKKYLTSLARRRAERVERARVA
ncbi:translational GTPase TypA [candidate division WWE3 bacterium CG_4_8_14_3_um_filter_42_11]|uniref:50S ribosomal subunit assembly factor BipA n=1 Tax=candidate division WWE3 bacterium CG_4_8_14_3_um_filter_42_11 TaxID=1975076 RepID=A0A2M8G6I8_UNCKA|nr:MAG: translational GTPase TypA [candidate division WWE3 bacterium CG_4_8_14_3_um_filter_42_11]